MSATTWATLRMLLVERYDDLRRRLGRRLGSDDLAAEVLHDTWLRLDRAEGGGEIARPHSYLYRVALNVAGERYARNRRHLGLQEVARQRHIDEERDPERTVVARDEVAMLVRALEELPPRCRDIFLAVRLDGEPHRDIAARYGISVRTVEREMRRAMAHCLVRLGKISADSVGSGDAEHSEE